MKCHYVGRWVLVRMVRRLLLLSLGLAVLFQATITESAAETPAGVKKLHDTIAVEKYHDARKLANGLLKTNDPAIRAQVVRPLGRIMLATGDTQGIEAYFKTLKKAKLDSGAQELIDVYQLWALALDGKSDQAIAGLQKIVDSGRPTYGALEAVDILAILELQRGNKEAAQKLVDGGLKLITYNEFKDPYIERLLKRRMSSKWFAGGGEAERIYNDAEALRKSQKFAAAGKLYARVQATFPDSPFADASGFRIGQCFLGLKQSRRAESHWREFINADSKASWRGQAYVALADVALLERLDIESAKEQLQSATQIYEQGVDEKALPSWQQAAVQLYFQQGILALAEHRHADAVSLLNSASREKSGNLAASVTKLSKIASDQQILLPKELSLGDNDARTVNTLGTIFVMLGRPAQARPIFSSLINGSRATKSAPHRSFAALNMARLYLSTDERGPAKKGYQYSLSQHPKGEWHDDTMRELALLIEREAREKYATALNSVNQKEGAKKLSDAEKQARLKEYLTVRSESVPYWVGIFQKFPKSPHVPQALFHMGQLYIESGKIEWAAKSFEKLTAEHPKSPWTGDAHVWLIDVKLEREFDLAAAQSHAQNALEWLQQLDRKAAEQARAAIVGSETAGLRTLRSVSYDIYVRAGLVEYLDQQYATAAARFESAKEFQPKRNFVVVHGTVPTGIERLIAAAKTGKSITPQEVLDGDSKARLILMLADLYHEGQLHHDALQLCSRVIQGAAPKATNEQLSWALFRRGRNFYRLEGEARNLEAATNDYMSAVKKAPDAPWSDQSLLLAANIQWNYLHNADTAIALWKRLVQFYPDSNEADRCAYYIGVVYLWSDRPELARAAFTKFLDERAGSSFAENARLRLNELNTQIGEGK